MRVNNCPDMLACHDFTLFNKIIDYLPPTTYYVYGVSSNQPTTMLHILKQLSN
jgi:hypothetical protein